MKHSIKIIIVAGAFVFFLCACSQKTNTGLIPATNLKRLGIKEKSIDRLDSLFGSALINQWAAGTSVLVAKDGRVIYNKSIGFRDRESKALLRNIDEFRISTMTQPIVSMAAMSLIEKGKLSLDDQVSKYLPEFAKSKVINTFNTKDTTYTTFPANQEITIRQLLTNTSGIGGETDTRLAMIYEKNNIPFFAFADKLTLGDRMKKLGTLPLSAQPNSHFYNGLSTDVLGAVIEKASGLTLDSVVSQNVLRPLGMTNTYFFLPIKKSNSLAVLYSETIEGRLERTQTLQGKSNLNYPISGAKTYLSGSSGMVSTVEDYAKFLQMVLNKGKFNNKQIVSAQTIELMTKNQIGDLMANGGKFGYGFYISTDKDLKNGAKADKLSGSGNFNTFFWIDPQRKAIAVLLTQVYPSYHSAELVNQFERIVNETLDNK
jgi:CubicO group peptidase (beta-lactamase class C family)